MDYLLREVSVPILPVGSPDIRILHFSDLHLTPARSREIRDIESWVDLDPDLVISTGDFLADKNAVPTVLDALGGLLNKPGLFVFGSNDYYEPSFKNPFLYLMKDKGLRKFGRELPWHDLDRGLQKNGWINLNHQRAIITVKGITIEARGTDDAHLKKDNYSEVAGPANASAQLAIGVTHAPYARVLNAMAGDNLDLIFAGHTHGGQVRLPWIGESKALVTNCDLPRWRARGLSKLDGEPYLHVSAGMGTSPFARIRVASPPEASLVTLTARN